jgi:adenylate cyclase
MKQTWKKYLAFLIHPIAIGLYITIVLTRLTFHYYDIASRPKEASQEQGLTGALYLAHQKSIDYRLRVRGPRNVDSNLALLAVDERAVATLGRWPWSRDIIAKGLDKAFGYGAKLVAFDIIFSEPQLNPARQVYDKVKAEGVGGDVANVLQSYTEKMDSDKILGAAYAKYADKIVAGSFFNDTRESSWPPETEFCRDMIFKRSPAAKQWDHEEVLLSVVDPFQPYLPKGLSENFAGILKMKEDEVRRQIGEPHNKNEEVALEEKIQTELHDMCTTILTDYREELNAHWADTVLAQENPQTFKFPTYDAWLEDYRAKSKPNSIAFADNWVMNTTAISAGTKHTAYFNTEQDSDGTIRSKALLVRTGNSYFPGLALKAYLVANNYNASPKLEFSPTTFEKEISDFEVTNNETGDSVMHIPTDHQGKLLINYAGPDQMFPYLSFADLLSDSPDAEIYQQVFDPKTKKWEKQNIKVKKADFIKDKIFIAGATATGIYDLRVTPFQENFPGTETHLNALENIIQRNFFRTMPNEAVIMPVFMAVVGLFLSVALSYLGAIWGLVLAASTIAGVWLYDQYFLFSKGVVVSIIWPLFLVLTLYVALTFYRYLTEERNKKELRQTFQKYVSPAIVEEILAHPDNIELGGRKANLTVFFSDVRGFTTISEKLDPRALSDLLNSYLTPMTEIVFKNRGTLDKYMGDAVMAFFGAPIGYKDHAKYACRCALQSLEKLHELQQEYERKGLPTIDIGIGLNTGDVNVGNMGSQTVRSYTVMGDAVNLASRLEGINKQYGTRIIMSEFTHKEVKDNFVCREVDWVRVKGKVLPVKIFELMAEEKVKSTVTETIKWFHEGYEHYHAKNWMVGLEAFAKALALTPEDEVAKLYIQRCQDYLTEPPADDWDGVFVMKTK